MKYIYSKIKLHIPRVKIKQENTLQKYWDISTMFDTSLLSQYMNRINMSVQLYANSSKIIVEQYVKFALSLLQV